MNVSKQFHNRIFLRICLFVIAFIWCVGFISPVFFKSINILAASYPFTKRIYSIVCHQIGAKTFSINNNNFLVCARCTGIYSGALIASLASLFYLSFNPRNNNLLLYSLIPLLLDVLFTTAGLYHYSKILAMATGLFFGSVSFTYILNILENNLLTEKNGY